MRKIRAFILSTMLLFVNIMNPSYMIHAAEKEARIADYPVNIHPKNTVSEFSDETTRIINSHNKDFNVNNFYAKMKEYGGYESYLKNQLGGVFAKWAGKTGNAKTATEFQEIAEYVLGLMVLYGMDYCNNNPSSYGKWMAYDGVSDDAFYPKGTDNGNRALATYDENDIDKICSGTLKIAGTNQGMNMVVDCATGIDRILNKAGIERAGDCYQVVKLIEAGAKIITRVSDLQVGDLVEVYLNRISNKSKSGFTNSTFGWNGWIHVMIVGDIDKDAGTITFYETGHDFTNTGNCKVTKYIADNNPYHGFEWVGIRAFNLEQDYGKGWKKFSDGSRVYVKDNGNRASDEWLTIDGEKFHFNKQGTLDVGYVRIGKYYYQLNDDASRGTLGKLLYWLKPVNNKWEYYDASGKRVTGWLWMNGHYYYFDNQGVMQTGWVKDDNTWYYLNDSGVMQIGWLKYNNNWYYLKNNGAMATKWASDNNNWYYFDQNGVMRTGWVKVDNTWYYLNKSGSMKTGWLKYNNNWYYLKNNGAMATKWASDNNNWYYFDANGIMKTGWKKVDNAWYYLNETGSMKTGWLKYNNKWYYLKKSGAMATGWIKDENSWYYLNKNGIMQTGWIKLNNTWYYLNDDGSMRSGWYKEENNWYYLNKSGRMAKNWLELDGNWYYFNDKGHMLTGWQTIKNKKYYFTTSGAMKTGWLKVDGDWYYFKDSGAMATGWQIIADNQGKEYWYYFDANGIMQKNQWIGKYHLLESGAMEEEETGQKQETTDEKKTLGKVEVLVSYLRKRSGPDTSYDFAGWVKEGDIYDVLSVEKKSDYTWYMIDQDIWIADDGTYLKYTEK